MPKMTKEHKEALAEGRKRAAAVKRYLEALEQHKPRRGRKRSKATVEKQLEKARRDERSDNPLTRVQAIQARLELEKELEAMQASESGDGLEAAEKDFVANAKPYAESKRISYAAFREAGVPAETLRKAGFTRGFNP